MTGSSKIEVHINGKVYGRGTGRNKQAAERMAAMTTMEMMEKSEI